MRGSIAGALFAITSCGVLERVDVEPDAQPDPPSAVLAADHVADPEPADPAPGPTSDLGLGAALADLVPAPIIVSEALGGDLELVEGITISNVTAGWTDTPKSGMRHVPGIVFEVLADVKVEPDVGLNQASLVAKATCLYDDDERRASSSNVYQPTGMSYVSAEAGEHTGAWAQLFPNQDIVGHTPCQLEFRVVSPHSDKPLRVASVWCVSEDETTEGSCAALTRPTRREDEPAVRDFSLDRWRRVANATITMQERVWLDRELWLRMTCDDGGGEKVPRLAVAPGNWGHLDPGDSVRVQFQNYYGWLAADPPCEVTFEWWRLTDGGVRAEPVRAATMCIRKYLPKDGPCFDKAEASSSGPPLTVRRFDLAIVHDPYNRSYARLNADVDIRANEDIDGRWDIVVGGSCGTGRRERPIYMSKQVNTEPTMLRAGEASTGTYTAWLGRGASSCKVELSLAPRTSSGEAPTPIDTYCVDRRGSKPC